MNIVYNFHCDIDSYTAQFEINILRNILTYCLLLTV